MRAKFIAALAGAAVAAVAAVGTAAAQNLKPFVMAASAGTSQAEAVDRVKAKLTEAGYEIVGSYSPYPAANIMVVTNDALKAAAAKSEFGGYGAGQRVSVTEVDGAVQVAYTNPKYMAAAYRMADDLAGPAAKLAAALGGGEEFGSEDRISADELRGYHYMFGMEYFDEPHTLAKHASYEAALAAVEKGLAAETKGISKVYRIDIPGKQETVFGVAMNGGKGGGQQDDAYIMSTVDFEKQRSTPHLPYEMLVSGDKVYALSARFRIAISFPDLSMIGSNSFFSIMGSPDAIRSALSHAAGGNWRPDDDS